MSVFVWWPDGTNVSQVQLGEDCKTWRDLLHKVCKQNQWPTHNRGLYLCRKDLPLVVFRPNQGIDKAECQICSLNGSHFLRHFIDEQWAK